MLIVKNVENRWKMGENVCDTWERSTVGVDSKKTVHYQL